MYDDADFGSLEGQLPQFFGNFEREVENLFEQFFTTGNAALGIQAFAPGPRLPRPTTGTRSKWTCPA